MRRPRRGARHPPEKRGPAAFCACAFLFAGATLLLPAGAPVAPALPNQFTGHASVLDGDTIEIGGVKIRLIGIDAPELRQTCRNHRGAKTPCGRNAAKALSALIGRRSITCSGEGVDVYGRVLAVCVAGETDINGSMVLDGHAMAFVKYDRRYADAEAKARNGGAGLWGGAFDAPWDWRNRIAAQASRDAFKTASAEGCTIKGNISRSAERIYHLPSHLHYARTRINRSRGEQMFCSEAEALAAGWRRALR